MIYTGTINLIVYYLLRKNIILVVYISYWMKIKVRMMPGGERSLDVPKGATYQKLLEKLKVDRETVIVFRNGKPVPEDEEVCQGDIKILKVVSGGSTRTIYWNKKRNTVMLIDQTLLPEKFKVIGCATVPSLVEAIKSLRVRGAPALGAAGAFGVALAAFSHKGKNLRGGLKKSAAVIREARPTAVNLSYGVDRVLGVALNGRTDNEVRKLALAEAQKIADEDVEINMRLGRHGAMLLKNGETVLTYCNAGRLACVDFGTALGVIRAAVQQGKKIKVFACETRPLNQGSRITAWELMQDGIDVTLIADNMAAHVMRSGKIDKIIVGADRITRDAVFNKIGTYMISVLAKEHKVPFYVAAPMSTFDLKRTEKEIKIEERDGDELRYFAGKLIAPKKVKVYNPAFDATPLENVSAIITEKGVLRPPYRF
jgi:methylthioribose-1-phosphate isomerase